MRAMLWVPATFNRLLWLLPTLFGLLAAIFVLSRVIPIDPAALIAGENASPSQVAEIRERYGFDKPWLVQFSQYIAKVGQGDLGTSVYTHRPIFGDLVSRIPATAELTAFSLLIAASVGIPFGVICGLHRNSLLDHSLRIATVAGIALTHFWVAIQLQLFFSMHLAWFPLSGRIDGFPPQFVTGFMTIDALISWDFEALQSALQHLILPALTLGLPAAATVQRFMRNSVVSLANSPSVTYQTAMGLPRRLIVWKYLLRMALGSTVTLLGLTAGIMLTGAVAVETVFDWPGLGNYAVNSILFSDYNALMGFTLFAGLIFAVINFLTDIIHVILDPRGVA